MSPHLQERQPPQQHQHSVRRVGLDGIIIDGGNRDGSGRRSSGGSSSPQYSPSSSYGSSSVPGGAGGYTGHTTNWVPPTNTWGAGGSSDRRIMTTEPAPSYSSSAAAGSAPPNNTTWGGGGGFLPDPRSMMGSEAGNASATPASDNDRNLVLKSVVSSDDKKGDESGAQPSSKSSKSSKSSTASTSSSSSSSRRSSRRGFRSMRKNAKTTEMFGSEVNKGLGVVDELLSLDDNDAFDDNGTNDSTDGVDGTSGNKKKRNNKKWGFGSGSRKEVGSQESEALFFLRTLVGVVLCCATALCALTVYKYLSSSEESRFKTTFESDAIQILDSIQHSIQETMDVTDGFATSIIANAKTTKSSTSAGNQTTSVATTTTEWPFVTVPGFAKQANGVMNVGNIRSVGMNVVVTKIQDPQMVTAWEEYANHNYNQWIDETVEYQLSSANQDGNEEEYDYIASYSIWGDNDSDATTTTDSGSFLPLWQHFPLEPTTSTNPFVYNEDAWRSTDENIEDLNDMFQNRKAILGALKVEETQDDGPFSVISYPIIDTPVNTIDDGDQNSNTYPIVARLRLSLHWIDIFQSISHSDRPINLVLYESCISGGADTPIYYTYRLKGSDVYYLGHDDEHDSDYDEMEVSSTLPSMMVMKRDPNGEELVVVEEDLGGSTRCNKTISLYPRKETEEYHRTNQPIYLAVLCVMIFLFTAIVFLFYDYLVFMRQQAVVKHAEVLSGIVTNLFPKRIHDKLYEKEQQANMEIGIDDSLNTEGNHNDDFIIQSFRQRRGSLLNTTGDNNVGGYDSSLEDTNNTKPPLADYFEESTVMFADISGFTRWSAARSPVEVFQLLETIYGAFDAIAKKRRVFKVETIGDCYLAGTCSLSNFSFLQAFLYRPVANRFCSPVSYLTHPHVLRDVH